MAQIIKFLEKYKDIIGFYVNNDNNNNDINNNNNNNNNNYNNAINTIPEILIEKVKEKNIMILFCL